MSDTPGHDYLEPCLKCNARMHLIRLYGDLMSWHCPACGNRLSELIVRRVPPPGTRVWLFAKWKAGQPTGNELSTLRDFWEPFRQLSVQELAGRFEGRATVELGDVDYHSVNWAESQARGLWLDADLPEAAS